MTNDATLSTPPAPDAVQKSTTNFCPCCSGTQPGHLGYEPESDCQPKPSEGTVSVISGLESSLNVARRNGRGDEVKCYEAAIATIERQAGEIETLHARNQSRELRIAELEADLADARLNERRYLWLREGGKGTGLYVADSGRDWCLVGGNELDDLTDDAIAAGDGK